MGSWNGHIPGGPPPGAQPAPLGDALTQSGGAPWDLFYKNTTLPM